MAAAGVVTAEAVVAGLTELADACARFDPALLPATELGDLLDDVQRHTNRIDAAVLAWTASFDRRNGARASGHRSTQHFLQDRLRLTPGAAKARTDAARALADGFDDTREALERGDISAEHAAAIVRGASQVSQRRAGAGDDQHPDGKERGADGPGDGEKGSGARPDGGAGADEGSEEGAEEGAGGGEQRHAADTAGDVEESLLAAARGGDASQVRRHARRLAQQADREDAERRARSAYQQRHLSVRHDGATTWLEGNLHQAAGERLFARLQSLADRTGPDDDRSYGQRLADALIEVCDGSTPHGVPAGVNGRQGSRRDGSGRMGRQGAGGGVVAVVPLETIERRAGAPPGSLLWSGPCPTETIAEAVCKAGLSWLITGADGQPLAYGTTRRFATTAQRAVLAARDGGCRWPGCSSRPLYAVAHHEPVHGSPGWGTDLGTMALLCEFHHGLRHHGGWRLRLDPDGTVTVTSPDRATVRTETAAQARDRHGMPSNFGGSTVAFDFEAEMDSAAPSTPSAATTAGAIRDLARETRAAYNGYRPCEPAGTKPRAGPGARAGPGVRDGPGRRARPTSRSGP